MAKVTVCKKSNFTVIDNGIFKDKRMSLKARGLLVTMLSLPEEWNYTVEGLVSILKDGKDSIRSTLKELEELNYLVRKRVRNDKGQLSEIEYIVYEQPTKNVENKGFEPKSENPTLDNPTLLNTKKIKNKNLNSATTSHKRYISCEIVDKMKNITNDSTIIDSVIYYLEKYKSEMCENHPNVSIAVLTRYVSLVDELLQDCLEDIKSTNGFIKMIDRHFDTNYGKRIDYNFPHFATEGIIEYQARNFGYLDGYKD